MEQSLEPPTERQTPPPAPPFLNFETTRHERKLTWVKPALGALALLTVIGLAIFQPWKSAPKPVATQEPFRPLGLFVDTKSPDWRITWNESATPLKNARSVDLFVREGEEQVRQDLTGENRQAATFSYRPQASDVTFRLEVTDAAGRITAESFRIQRQAAPAPVAATVPPKAIHRVAPEVPGSIKNRIRGSVSIDVRVQVDAKGHVTAASPVKKHKGLDAYLAQRAVTAAKQWKFTPAKQDGKPILGSQVIHFVFDR